MYGTGGKSVYCSHLDTKKKKKTEKFLHSSCCVLKTFFYHLLGVVKSENFVQTSLSPCT